MIFVTHQQPVNAPGEPQLDRRAVWDGLMLEANNALPFVPSMTYCEVTERYDDNVFDRDIEFRGQRFTERITMEPTHRVVFTRIAGPVLGTIANEIEGQKTTCSLGSVSLSSLLMSKEVLPRSRSMPTP